MLEGALVRAAVVWAAAVRLGWVPHRMADSRERWGEAELFGGPHSVSC